MAWYFIGFIFLILSLLALDLGIFNRNHRVITAKSAILWTCFWVFVSLLFNGLIFLFYDKHWLNIGTHLGFPSTGIEAFLTFLTAYLVEKSLSVDNIFVIAMVFSYFKVPAVYQHRVLFWGILGALIMRGVMIYAGIAAVSTFSWLSYVFGGLLFITAARMMVIKEENFSLEKNIVFSLLKRRFFITPDFHQHRFFVRISGKWAATPLFLALMIIESMDLLFAIDSIPAVLAITLDPFIVFTSNVFAILGMRSLYFALASLIERFRYLRTSLVFILAFVGSKMILGHHIPIDPLISLGVIMVILGIGIGASFLKAKTTEIKKKTKGELHQLSQITVRKIKRLFCLIIGCTLMLIGAVMLLLPGPGILVIFFGLTLLAVEFVWAKIWLQKIQSTMQELHAGAKKILKREKIDKKY